MKVQEEDSDFGGDRVEPPIFKIKKNSMHYKDFNMPDTVLPRIPVEKRPVKKYYVGVRRDSMSSLGERTMKKALGINVTEVSPNRTPDMNQTAVSFGQGGSKLGQSLASDQSHS